MRLGIFGLDEVGNVCRIETSGAILLFDSLEDVEYLAELARKHFAEAAKAREQGQIIGGQFMSFNIQDAWTNNEIGTCRIAFDYRGVE